MRLLGAGLHAGAHVLISQVRGPFMSNYAYEDKKEISIGLLLFPFLKWCRRYFCWVSSCQYASLYACSLTACLEQSLVNRAKGAVLRDTHSSLLAIMLARPNSFAFWPCCQIMSFGQQCWPQIDIPWATGKCFFLFLLALGC